MDATTEAAVERVRKALHAKREAMACEQKANYALVAAKDASFRADTEANEAQAALRAILVKQPPSEVVAPPSAPEPPTKKPMTTKLK